MSGFIGERAKLYDIDDTLVARERITRVAGAAKGKVKAAILDTLHHNPKTYSLNDIPLLDHTPIYRPMRNSKEEIAYHFHIKRKAFPGVAERVRRESTLGIVGIGNSGRNATALWLGGTRSQMDREGIPLRGIILTPDKVSSKVSKVDGIREVADLYEDVEVADDDVDTIFFEAPFFPGARFNLILHEVTNRNVTEEMLALNPNVRLVPITDWIREDFE
jgi:hypothetical protein